MIVSGVAMPDTFFSIRARTKHLDVNLFHMVQLSLIKKDVTGRRTNEYSKTKET